jgi:hypothetical protein
VSVGRRCSVLWLLSIILFSSVTHARAFDFNDDGWEGTSELLELARGRLGRDRVELVATLDYGVLGAGDGVLVLHPESKLNAVEVGAFLSAGGRLALLDDYGVGSDLLGRFQIQRLGAPLRPAQSLRQNPNLAVAVPAVQSVAGQEQGRHPVVAHVDRVITNHPSALGHPNLTPVLTIPAQGEPDATLAVTGIIGHRGRLFAMGDPSVVINLMLRYPGNRALAEGLVDYLLEEDSWGRRGGKLYLLSNSFGQHGHYGGKGGLVADVREALASLGDRFAETRQNGLSDLWALVLACFAVFGTVAWVGSMATRVYGRTAPRYALGTPLVAQGGVAGHAAQLGAPTTRPAFALLELRSALEEGIAVRLGISQPGPNLLEEIDRQGALGQRSSGDLRQLLAELDQVSQAVSRHQPVNVTKTRLGNLQARVSAILDEIDQRTGRKQV